MKPELKVHPELKAREIGMIKSYEIKAKTAELDDNCLKGGASVVGVMDRSGDVIFPGAWKSTLKDFLANGFVAVGHAWDQLPVAMPVVAKEDGNQLYTEAIFHSTTAAQDARTVCKERLENDLSVGLSVGFMLDWSDDDHPPYLWFESGQKLLDYADANGYAMKLFDVKGIKACKGYCRGILNIDSLLEYSIVPVPCNPAAQASEAKGFLNKLGVMKTDSNIETERDFEAFLRDAGYSRKEATAITLHGFKALQRDADSGESDAEGELEKTQTDPDNKTNLDTTTDSETKTDPETKTNSETPIEVKTEITPENETADPNIDPALPIIPTDPAALAETDTKSTGTKSAEDDAKRVEDDEKRVQLAHRELALRAARLAARVS